MWPFGPLLWYLSSLVQSFSWANQARSMSSPAQWSGAPCLRRPRKILNEQFMICHQNEKLLPCRVHVLVAKAASLWPVCQIICILRPACESSGTRNKKSRKPSVMNPNPMLQTNNLHSDKYKDSEEKLQQLWQYPSLVQHADGHLHEPPLGGASRLRPRPFLLAAVQIASSNRASPRHSHKRAAHDSTSSAAAQASRSELLKWLFWQGFRVPFSRGTLMRA